jgi:flagellar L-ring protein FlgH
MKRIFIGLFVSTALSFAQQNASSTSSSTNTADNGAGATTTVTSGNNGSPGDSGNGKNNKKKKKEPAPSALDKYIREASVPQASNGQVADNGSLWSPAARLSDLAADLRARHVDDVVTIVVNESASAVSTGQSKTSRASSANASITSLAGIKSPTGGLANLLNLGSSQSLDGEGTTSRQTTLTTTVSARVTHVLVNGNLVVEGTKNLNVNSENQVITVRGVIRPIDLDTTNTVLSARLAQMEIQVNGKGIVNDAVKRPFFLYRLLLGLLPF